MTLVISSITSDQICFFKLYTSWFKSAWCVSWYNLLCETASSPMKIFWHPFTLHSTALLGQMELCKCTNALQNRAKVVKTKHEFEDWTCIVEKLKSHGMYGGMSMCNYFRKPDQIQMPILPCIKPSIHCTCLKTCYRNNLKKLVRSKITLVVIDRRTKGKMTVSRDSFVGASPVHGH